MKHINKKTNIPDYFPYNGEVCFVEGSTCLQDYLMGGFMDETRDKKASNALGRLMGKYGLPKCGRNRAVFISKAFVIKFPLNDSGEDNNSTEAMFVSDNVAKGRAIIIEGFSCLMQEKLIIVDNLESIIILPKILLFVNLKNRLYFCCIVTIFC